MLKLLQEKSKELKNIFNFNIFGYQAINEEQVK